MIAPGRKRGFEQTVPTERILAFLRNIMSHDPGSCIATYRAGGETVAVYGKASRVADRIRSVSLDQGFTLVGVEGLTARTFRGTPEEIEERMRWGLGKDGRLVNADLPPGDA